MDVPLRQQWPSPYGSSSQLYPSKFSSSSGQFATSQSFSSFNPSLSPILAPGIFPPSSNYPRSHSPYGLPSLSRRKSFHSPGLDPPWSSAANLSGNSLSYGPPSIPAYPPFSLLDSPLLLSGPLPTTSISHAHTDSGSGSGSGSGTFSSDSLRLSPLSSRKISLEEPFSSDRLDTSEWRSTTNVYIKGLPERCTTDDLRAWADQVANPISVKVISDSRDPSICTGLGFVRFELPASATLFIALVNAQPGYEACFAKETYVGKIEKASDPRSANLYLSHIPLSYDEEDVRALFPAPFYVVRSLRLLHEGDRPGKRAPPGTPFRGAGFIRLDSREMAERAVVELNGKHLPGHGRRPGRSPRPNGDFHDYTDTLQVRFADTDLQKHIKKSEVDREVRETIQANIGLGISGIPLSRKGQAYRRLSIGTEDKIRKSSRAKRAMNPASPTDLGPRFSSSANAFALPSSSARSGPLARSPSSSPPLARATCFAPGRSKTPGLPAHGNSFSTASGLPPIKPFNGQASYTFGSQNFQPASQSFESSLDGNFSLENLSLRRSSYAPAPSFVSGYDDSYDAQLAQGVSALQAQQDQINTSLQNIDRLARRPSQAPLPPHSLLYSNGSQPTNADLGAGRPSSRLHHRSTTSPAIDASTGAPSLSPASALARRSSAVEARIGTGYRRPSTGLPFGH